MQLGISYIIFFSVFLNSYTHYNSRMKAYKKFVLMTKICIFFFNKNPYSSIILSGCLDSDTQERLVVKK